MDRAHLPRLSASLARAEIAAHDPAGVAALRRALDGPAPPVSVRRHGSVIGYRPGTRLRLVEIDRRGHLVAAYRWGESGGLAWVTCRTADGRWIGVEPDSATHPAWGPSDRVWAMNEHAPWRPAAPITVYQALDYARLDVIPPLAEPRRLPPGAGTALLNVLAGLMQDQGVARARYRGPYPSEHLFTSLLEAFRYDPAVHRPLERFLAGEPLDWLPAPHERHHVSRDVCVQMREEVEKVVLGTTAFYRVASQEVLRREPRVVRGEGDRVVCSLWALGQPLEDRLVLDATGEIVERRSPVDDPRPPAPASPIWRAALASLVARESAPPLGASIRQVMASLRLEWGPVPGDLLRVDGEVIRVSRLLLDAGAARVRAISPGAERAAPAVRLVVDVARLLAPEVRRRAQMALEALPEDEQLRLWEGSAGAADTPLDDSVARLVALVAGGGS
ncbi:MAG: hypothetical protein HYY95_04845 [Candidatus Rokubacteria bacterium]|nr:hypothetical protein [Candidatus Rokubacteria bacterium]